MRTTPIVGTLLALSMAPSLSLAQAQPASDRPSVYEPPPPRPGQRPGAGERLHDGFFLRMGLGAGYVSDQISGDGFDASINGPTIPIELLIGGSPIPGLVVGGALWADPLLAPNVEVAGYSATVPSDYDLQYSRLGLFVDVYPDPTAGGHILGSVAYAAFSVTESGGDEELLANAKGPAFGIGGGYEWWVGRQWSIGVQATVSYASLTAPDESHDLVSAGVLASFTYH